MTGADLEALKADLIRAFEDITSRVPDPVALACRVAGEDPTPGEPDIRAELDAALADKWPGVPLDEVKRRLGL